MGNQGTKNWKLGAFFAVSLMLIAGLFSNAAIAGNGDGQIKVEETSDTEIGILEADLATQTLIFTYAAFNDANNNFDADNGETAINMNGGSVQIVIPSGWKVPIANVRATDGTDDLFFTDAAATDADNLSPEVPIRVNADGTQDALKRIKLTKDGDNITMVEVQLDAEAWGTGTNRDVGRALVITFTGVTVAIPSSLAYIDGENMVASASYQFTTRSKGKDGIFTRLRPTTTNQTPQPRVKVGNIGPGKGKVTISPTVAYEAEEVTFMINVKATGPIYDSTDFDSDIEIDLVGGVTGLAPLSDDNVKVSRTRGSVRFESGEPNIDVQGSTATINISRMNTDAEVHISYGPVTIGAISASTDSNTASVFTVSTKTSDAAASPIPVADVAGGRTQAKDGSGTVTLSPDIVEAGATSRTFTVTYKADTDVAGNLIITLPVDTVDAAILTFDDPATDAVETDLVGSGQVSTPDTTEATKTVADDGTTITWTGLDLKKGGSFRTNIGRVNVADTTGKFAWGARLNPTGISSPDNDLTPAQLYVIETEPRGVQLTANPESSSVEAASEQEVVFTFTAAGTPIRKGKVRLIIPSGWTPPTIADAAGKVAVSAGDVKKVVHISGRSITVDVEELPVVDDEDTADDEREFKITYGSGKKAVVQSTTGTIEIPGFFRASPTSSERSAGSVQIDVTNVMDGAGSATISLTSVRAGSTDNEMVIIFTAKGTMDGGNVRLQAPNGWGAMQRDPLKRNYINVVTSRRGSLQDVDYGSNIVVANLNRLGPGDTVTFIYGRGTGSRANRGAAVQTTIGTAKFIISSDGNGDGISASVAGSRALDGAVKEANPDGLGEVFTGTPGELKVTVTGAADGTGTANVDIIDTKAGTQTYKDEQGEDVSEMRIHAGDDSTYLKFTYEPGQTIAEGQLMFTVPGGWSNPQGGDPGAAGYTRVDSDEPATFDGNSLTVDIVRLDQGDSIVIHYGEYAFEGTEGGAVAPAVVTASSRFAISVRGTKDGVLSPIDPYHRNTDLDVQVWAQASGGGMAMIAVTDDMGDLNAGNMGRELTITYTASGQVKNGAVKLTTPDEWSAPMMANVNVSSTGSIGAPDAGGNYGEGETLPEGLGARDVIVGNVVLAAGDTVTFVYSDVTVQTTVGTGTFNIASMGSEGPGTKPIPLDDLTVDVGEAAAGSGMAMVDPMFVTAGTNGNTLTFTYTVAGEATYPRDIRVAVPEGWSMPSDAGAADANKGTYAVSLMRDGKAVSSIIQRINTIDGSMVARVQAGGAAVMGGDMVVFEYQNADAPAAPERSMFTVSFDGTEVSSPVVAVVSGEAVTQLVVSVSGDISVDTGNSVTVTVMLQDANGDETGTTTDLDVTLTSSSAMGSFSMTADGDAMDMVTILAGSSSAMVYYSDSTVGTAIITASATDLTSDTATVMVTTDVVEITSVSVDPMVAMAGAMVTVSAMGTPGKEAMFSVGSIVTDKAMTEGESGSYSGYFTVVVDQHADGMYNVTVSLNGESMMAANQLTIDSTAPMVTASAAPATAADGDMVTITAMVEDAGEISSVMANVSMLDSMQTEMIALTMADGSYSGSFTISDENEAENGMKEITVTAMDAAGNSGMGSAMVELKNELVYTSMIPADISLFHVPLDVEGLDTVSDLAEMLGDAVSLVITRDTASGSWESDSSDVMITADLGIVLSMKTAMEVTFTGSAWGDGTSMISVMEGQNLIGLPLNDSRVSKVSDIMGLFDEGVVIGVVVSDEGTFRSVIRVDDPGDNPVAGDASYLVTANADATAMVMGEGWSNGGGAAAAPIALIGHKVDNQTPVLLAEGSVVDELTGLAKEGFRVKVKNLSTRSSLSSISQSDAENGYDMTFVNLTTGNAARVGDVLEISADSPNPLIGIQPLRHIITVNDVRNSRIQLENLIAYEIPAETELLRNYPNPFNPETWIPFRLAEDAVVTLTIYDTAGRVVRGIDIGHQPAAVYETRAKAIYWDGRNDFGEQVASGIYFYNLSAGEEFSGTRKMLILK